MDNNSTSQFSVYSTATLLKVIPNLFTASTFFLDNFFTQQINSQTEEVAIDIDVGMRRMAPFVSPLEEGTLVESWRIQTKTFKPPYIKDKRAPDLNRPVRRMIGEQIGGGSMTAQQRYLANLAFEMADQLDVLKRRQEWMATQSIVNGYLVIKGQGYPETLIDFQRSAALNIVLAGKDMWDDSNSTADPTDDIRQWVSRVLKKSGSTVTDLVFTNSAYNALIKKKDIQQVIFNSSLRGNTDANLTMGPTMGLGAIPQGYWGSYRIWLYNEWYLDETNQERPMIPDGTVIGLSRQIEGIRAYGVIMDPELGYIPAPYAPKMWMNQDPALIFLMMQSAPLTIVGRANASFVARVAKGKDNG